MNNFLGPPQSSIATYPQPQRRQPLKPSWRGRREIANLYKLTKLHAIQVPQLLVVGGTDQYFTKQCGDQYRYIQLDCSVRQTLWQVSTRILQAGRLGCLART